MNISDIRKTHYGINKIINVLENLPDGTVLQTAELQKVIGCGRWWIQKILSANREALSDYSCHVGWNTDHNTSGHGSVWGRKDVIAEIRQDNWK